MLLHELQKECIFFNTLQEKVVKSRHRPENRSLSCYSNKKTIGPIEIPFQRLPDGKNTETFFSICQKDDYLQIVSV